MGFTRRFVHDVSWVSRAAMTRQRPFRPLHQHLLHRLLQCAACAVVVWASWMVLSVRRLDPDSFDWNARGIERTPTWRYGYVRHDRGGLLVRARLEAGAPPFTPVDASNTIAPAMRRALHTQRRAVAVWSVLCALLWTIVFNGFLPLRRTLARVNAARRLQQLGAASSTPQYTG